jgi:hypothetical protein
MTVAYLNAPRKRTAVAMDSIVDNDETLLFGVAAHRPNTG